MIAEKCVTCTACGLDCDPGDYGTLRIAATGSHFARECDGFALPAEGMQDKLDDGTPVCNGSQLLGYVKDA